MKLTDLWRSLDRPSLSYEFFPPRSPQAGVNQQLAIGRVVGLDPDFVSVTFGAGGSTVEGSRALVDQLRCELELEVLAYFACYGLDPEQIAAILDGYASLGVDNVLAVRGDVPKDRPDFAPHPDALPHASDLLPFLRDRFDFCLGAAAYPEGHIEADDLDADLDFVQLKVDNGAEFLVTNYSYDPAYFLGFLEKVRARGIDVPVIAGVMPIVGVKMMNTLAKVCGATIPDALQAGLDALPEGDKKALANYAVDFATKQCTELIENDVQGLHFYTMNRGKLPARIVKNLRQSGALST